MVSLMISSDSFKKWRFLGITSIEQYRLTSLGMQHHSIRCNTRKLQQTCMLFSVSRLLENEIFHLQVQNILQYGRYIFQTFLMCAIGPYLFANKKSFGYLLNWQNSEAMYTVGHQGYHGGLSTEMFFKEFLKEPKKVPKNAI